MTGSIGGALFLVLGIAFFGWIAALIFRRVLGWYLDGEISGSHFVIASVAFFSALILMFLVPSPAFKVFLALALAGLAVAAPVFKEKLIDRKDLYRFHNEQIDRYRSVIAQRPDNVAARLMLAEELYKQGCLDEAIEELSEADRLSPHLDTAKRLESMIREREERGIVTRVCPSCGHTNLATLALCENCGGETRLARAIVKSFGVAETKRIVVPTCIVAAVLTILMFLFLHLTPVFRIMAVCFTMLFLLIATLVHLHRQP